jgi:hypothetical protein
MPNTYGNYDEIFFGQEALIWLRNNLGMAARVYRDFAPETAEQFEIVKMRRPGTFTAQDHVNGTGSSNQDVNVQNVDVSLSFHKEVKFRISDRDLVRAGGRRIITDHIGPATTAIAETINTSLVALGPKIGPMTVLTGSPTAADYLVNARQTLFDNKCPVNSGNLNFAVDGKLAALFLKDQIFNQSQVTGGTANQDALIRGTLAERYGFSIFEEQGAGTAVAQQTSTLGASGSGDKLGAVNGAAPVNATTIAINALTDGQTITIGQTTFTIAGDPTVYSILAGSSTTVASSGLATVNIFPALQQPASNGAVVTFRTRTTVEEGALGTVNTLAFHRNAIGLRMAALPTEGNGMGARIFTASDPMTGLSLRTRMWYEGASSMVNVAIDALWGCEVLNPMLGTRVVRAA